MDPVPDPSSYAYTHHRLLHATPEHLHLTSRRVFVGPIPEAWLRSHRKEWYRHHLHLNYSSKNKGFSSDGEDLGTERRDEEGPSASALYSSRVGGQAASDEEASEDEAQNVDVGDEVPVISAPRSREADDGTLDGHIEQTRSAAEDEADVIDDAVPLAEDAVEEQHADAEPVPRATNTNGIPLTDSTNRRPVSLREMTNRESNRLRPPDVHGSNRRYDKVNGKGPVKPSSSLADNAENRHSESSPLRISSVSSRNETVSSQSGAGDLPNADASTSSLLQHDAKIYEDSGDGVEASDQHVRRGILGRAKRAVTSTGNETGNVDDAMVPERIKNRIHFDIPDTVSQAAMHTKARMEQLDLKKPLKTALRRRTGMDGQILKMEKMLVRIDTTLEKKLPNDYDENTSQGYVTQTIEKWREFMVVCRQSRKNQAEDFVLQIWKTRVIPAIEKASGSKKPTRELPLNQHTTAVNLYSSLDKSVVLWMPHEHGTRIIVLRPSTTQSGVEWFTFLRSILGSHRSKEIIVNVPDMSVSLRIRNPFQELEHNDDDDPRSGNVAQKAAAKERAVAQQIVDRCLESLKALPEWQDLVDAWIEHQRIGLAWKRYDRLEWIYGANERKMYGTIALDRHMDLELRTKEHYSTQIRTRKGKQLIEPAAVEGFLVRLTSQKGVHKRMGKLFFKRLYFHTQDHYLVFTSPAKAKPPPPPEMHLTEDSNIPSSHELATQIPLDFEIDPYPIVGNEIEWLKEGSSGAPEERQRRDRDAQDEFRRRVQNLNDCEGYIDLCDIRKVRKVKFSAEEAQDFSVESDTEDEAHTADEEEEDGTADGIDTAKTFEIVLQNDLVIRLQAYSAAAKKEWKSRLRVLVKYWRYRNAADTDLLKGVRRQNLNELDLDEELEAEVGQFAKKWEVQKSYASSQLYNMCGLSGCRAISLSGLLYFKPRLHSLFTATYVLLIPGGKLLLFATTARSSSGRSVPTIDHSRIDTIDLADCYLYSGLLTENDLLYQNRTFDSNNPGHSALPRMWPTDGAWTSRDEDVMCCFVLWRPLKRGLFRSPGSGGEKGTRLRRVTKLGATGRGSVFRARSRVERDRWVGALAAEMEKVNGGVEVRIVE